MKGKHYGQITVEFVIILTLLFSLFGFALFVYSEQNKGLILSKESFNANYLAGKMANEINRIYWIDGNSSAKLLLEPDFSYSFEGRILEIKYRSNYASAALMTDQITDSTGNNLTGKEIIIKKKDGVIFIEGV